MRSRGVFGFALTSAILLLSFACSSVPEVTYSDDPTNPPGGEGGVDGGNDGPVPGCTPTGQEVCDDGIDNDCNGKADCEDPFCTAGFACVDAPPAGWTAVILAPASRPPCPAGYTSPTELRVVTGNGNFTCQCQCTPSGGTNPTCAASGMWTIKTGTDNTCDAGADTQQFPASTNNQCQNKMYDSQAFAEMMPNDQGPAACAGGDNDNGSRIQPKDGVKCVPPAAGGKGCSGAQLCKPKATGFLQCIAKLGNEACPSGYTKQHRTGTTVNDQRTCSGCTCNTQPCLGEVEIWAQPNCMGNSTAKITTATHGTCAAATPVANAKSFKSTIGGGCSVATQSTASGALSFGNEETICCK